MNLIDNRNTITAAAGIEFHADVRSNGKSGVENIEIEKQETNDLIYQLAVKCLGQTLNPNYPNYTGYEVTISFPHTNNVSTEKYWGSKSFTAFAVDGLVSVCESDRGGSSTTRYINPQKIGFYESKSSASYVASETPVVVGAAHLPKMPTFPTILPQLAALIEKGKAFVPADGKKVSIILYTHYRVFLYAGEIGPKRDEAHFYTAYIGEEFGKCESRCGDVSRMIGVGPTQVSWHVKFPGTNQEHTLEFIEDNSALTVTPTLKLDDERLGIIFCS